MVQLGYALDGPPCLTPTYLDTLLSVLPIRVPWYRSCLRHGARLNYMNTMSPVLPISTKTGSAYGGHHGTSLDQVLQSPSVANRRAF